MKRVSSPALRFGSAAFVLVIATMFCAAGCGASSSPAGYGDAKTTTPSIVPIENPPQNLSEAQAQFAAAEQSVFGAFGQGKPEAQGRFASPPGQQIAQAPISPAGTTAAEASPPPAPKDADHPMKEGEAKPTMSGASTGTADAAGLSSSPCETACRALASMNRAATHICSLAGDDSDQCTNARERVRLATERVRQSCSECSP